MNTVTIWRLEDADGNGIYRFSPDGSDGECYFDIATNGEYADDFVAVRIHPRPIDDIELNINEFDPHKEAMFGFASLEQMKRWVHKAEWRENLASLGVLLNEYAVPVEHAAIGTAQAAFRVEHAMLVGSHSPDDVDF